MYSRVLRLLTGLPGSTKQKAEDAGRWVHATAPPWSWLSAGLIFRKLAFTLVTDVSTLMSWNHTRQHKAEDGGRQQIRVCHIAVLVVVVHPDVICLAPLAVIRRLFEALPDAAAELRRPAQQLAQR